MTRDEAGRVTQAPHRQYTVVVDDRELPAMHIEGRKIHDVVQLEHELAVALDSVAHEAQEMAVGGARDRTWGVVETRHDAHFTRVVDDAVERRPAQIRRERAVSVLCGIAAIPALFFGLKAQKEIKASPVPVKNAWMAQAGMGLGGVGALILLVAAVRGSAPDKNAKTAASASANATSAPVASTTPASTTSATAQGMSALAGGADYWSSPELVELEDKGDRFMDGFWPLFGDVRQKRHDEARETLMKEKPATWQAESSALWKAQAAAFDAKAADIKKKSYRCRVEKVVFPYDATKHVFPVRLEGVQLVGGGHLVLDGKPKVSKRAEKRADDPIEDLSYSWEGGRERTFSIPVDASEADAFAKKNQHVFVDLAFTITSAEFNVDEPAVHFTGPVKKNWVSERLEKRTTGAGHAIGVKVCATRVSKSDGTVLRLHHLTKVGDGTTCDLVANLSAPERVPKPREVLLDLRQREADAWRTTRTTKSEAARKLEALAVDEVTQRRARAALRHCRGEK